MTVDGKTLLDLVEKGLKARTDYRTRKHTENERLRVEAIEAELTAFLARFKGADHDRTED